jgi:hypothetical protein
VVPSRQSLRSRDTVDATRRVFVTAGSSLGVPAAGLFDVDWNENADFIEVSQGELGRGETTLSSALGIGECKLIVLLENALVPAKEPFADSHLSLRFSLPRCKRIVVQGKRGIEVTTQLTELVRSTHLDLRLGESMVGSLFNVDTSCVEIESQIGLRNADLGKLPSEKHTIDVGALRCILVAGLGREPDVLQTFLEILALAMLPQENHHSQTVVRGGIGPGNTPLIVSDGLLGLSGALELHSNTVFCARISLLGRSRIASEGFFAIHSVAKLAEFQPHTLDELSLGMMLLSQEADDIQRISFQLLFDLRRMRARRLRQRQTSFILRGYFNKGQSILGPRQLHFRVGSRQNSHTMVFQFRFALLVGGRNVGRGTPQDGERGEVWMIHAVVGSGLRIRTMIVGLALLRWGLVSRRGSLGELLQGLRWLLLRTILRGRLLRAAGVAGVMFHLRNVVLHIFGDFRHHPLGGGGDDLWHVEVILAPWIPSRTQRWLTTALRRSVHPGAYW